MHLPVPYRKEGRDIGDGTIHDILGKGAESAKGVLRDQDPVSGLGDVLPHLLIPVRHDAPSRSLEPAPEASRTGMDGTVIPDYDIILTDVEVQLLPLFLWHIVYDDSHYVASPSFFLP